MIYFEAIILFNKNYLSRIIYQENYPFSEDLFEEIILNTCFQVIYQKTIYEELFMKNYL
jgi:hypothetical protein